LNIALKELREAGTKARLSGTIESIRNLFCWFSFLCNIRVLENVAIENALQLEAARAMPVLNYDAMRSLTLLNLSIAVLSIFAADTLLYAMTFTFDL